MPIVEEFIRNLRREGQPGALWRKIDLHNHSPASFDFQGDRQTAIADFAEAIRDRKLSVVMFTDHGRLPESNFLMDLHEQSGAFVVPGVELNVFVDAFNTPADKVGRNIYFHLLIGFDPNGERSPAYWVEHLYRSCQEQERDCGGHSIRGVADKIDRIYEVLAGSQAILIPAHLHSGADAFHTRSIDLIYEDREFLDWTRKYFTALDVRNDKTAAFFDGKHAETGHIEISCIRSSDAHEAAKLGTSSTWAQLDTLSYSDLKAALEMPSRVSRLEPQEPESFVMGIHIEGEFLKDFWLPLSPHCNVLIGVKGSGKTSVLECLRFALGADVPGERSEDVRKHLSAILGPAGRVRVLLKRDDGALVIVERRMTDSSFRLTFADDREVLLPTREGMRFAASILGWHEIEHAATDRQIRRLHMDAIAGRDDVQRLTEHARLSALGIRQLHETAAARYGEYVQLAEVVQRQESLREGLQQLKDANLIELRDQISSALADRQELARLVEHLKRVPDSINQRVEAVLQLSQFKFSQESPLTPFVKTCYEALAVPQGKCDSFPNDLAGDIANSLAVAIGQLRLADDRFASFTSEYQARLQSFPPEIQRLLESHREVLEKTRDLPTLRARMEEMRQQIVESLEQLSAKSTEVARTLDSRHELRDRRVREFNEMLAEARVVLNVTHGASKLDEFQPAFSQFGDTRETLNFLRNSHGTTKRFHDVLAECYKDLKTDLMSGDKVVFMRADFGHLITVLENDDLEIRFAVGKPGEEFSLIDQLSAGQRCTAVFPILLKLKGGPLVIDQPEDNLDNRHIAKSVAPVLMEDKRIRQIVMTSHNANLVVLSDPEFIVVFEAESGRGKRIASGFLAHRLSSVTSHVLDILDGGEKALSLRSRKYGKAAS